MIGMWFDVRRRLRSPLAKWFVALLLGLQLIPITYACVMPMAGASMAYVDAVMPEPCADLPKEACLVAYIQDDRAIGGVGGSIDRKSTRLNSSHRTIKYAGLCLE